MKNERKIKNPRLIQEPFRRYALFAYVKASSDEGVKRYALGFKRTAFARDTDACAKASAGNTFPNFQIS